jgi:hypothetical protein
VSPHVSSPVDFPASRPTALPPQVQAPVVTYSAPLPAAGAPEDSRIPLTRNVLEWHNEETGGLPQPTPHQWHHPDSPPSGLAQVPSSNPGRMQGGVAVFHPTSGYQATPQMHAQSPAPVMQGKHAMHTPQYPQQHNGTKPPHSPALSTGQSLGGRPPGTVPPTKATAPTVPYEAMAPAQLHSLSQHYMQHYMQQYTPQQPHYQHQRQHQHQHQHQPQHQHQHQHQQLQTFRQPSAQTPFSTAPALTGLPPSKAQPDTLRHPKGQGLEDMGPGLGRPKRDRSSDSE